MSVAEERGRSLVSVNGNHTWPSKRATVHCDVCRTVQIVSNRWFSDIQPHWWTGGLRLSALILCRRSLDPVHERKSNFLGRKNLNAEHRGTLRSRKAPAAVVGEVMVLESQLQRLRRMNTIDALSNYP